jgi:predicted flap endonuclease-1-like 5' DNA nuclease
MSAMIFLQETSPNTELGWLLYVFLGFFLLMVIVGWLVSSRKEEQPVAPHETQSHHEEKVAAVEPVSPPSVKEAAILPEAQTVPDDLVRLEGIGPRVAKILNDAGIRTFAGLAAANAADIQKTLSAAGLQMMNPEGWIEQASLAAKGDWVGLEKLQDELKGGRKK